ncbi:MAG: hypothetical protein FGM56_02985 [Limnohabitans sp.]|nr:hypothetical protein [Limnohabitans sp.]
MLNSVRWLTVLLLGALLCVPLHARAAEQVKSITVEGGQRIEPSAVISYLGLKEGENYTPYDLDFGLKKIYETGFYSDVSVSNDNGAITITVKENPSINQVIFEGNDKVDKEDLEKEITLKSRSVYSKAKGQNDLKRLLDVYRRNGRYSAEITPQIISLEQNRVNLVYNIQEGPKALIEKITFIGNDSYESDTLSKVISSSRERSPKCSAKSDKMSQPSPPGARCARKPFKNPRSMRLPSSYTACSIGELGRAGTQGGLHTTSGACPSGNKSVCTKST